MLSYYRLEPAHVLLQRDRRWGQNYVCTKSCQLQEQLFGESDLTLNKYPDREEAGKTSELG